MLPPCSPNVMTNALPQARGADELKCMVAAPNFITTGAGTVFVNGKLAARVGSKTLHPPSGEIIEGSSNVFIGGPAGGATLGDPDAGTAACQAAMSTRHTPGKTQQSYGNCAVESWRIIINRGRAAKGLPPISEDDLLAQAIALGLAVNNPGGHNHGAMSSPDQAKLLGVHGIENGLIPQSPQSVQAVVAEGKGVVVTIHPYHWGSYVTPDWYHAVAVTGVEYDENGNPKAYIINDTGLGTCGLKLTASQFDQNSVNGVPIAVTKAKEL